jgi:leucyl aminopeptidase (aminopeptidase T)
MVEDLDRAVRTVVERCLAVGAGDDVLVVADPGNAELGDALMHAARAAGGDAVLAILPPNPSRGTEPPSTVATALAAADVFIAPCLPSLSHTTARKRASEGGARGATMPGVTADLLARLMSADFDAMSSRCHAIADLLTAAGEAHVTCPRGTDIRLDLRGRGAIADDGDLRAKGAFGNLPCGEGFASPAGGVGTIAASSLFGALADPPVLLTVTDVARPAGPYSIAEPSASTTIVPFEPITHSP